jgi:thermitase
VLPLDKVKEAYEKVAGMVVGSPALLIQPAFAKIGYYGVVLHATGKGVTIANLDTGADTCHEALRGIFTYNFVVNEPRAPEDCPVSGVVQGNGFGHGTAVASLLRTLAPEANVWSLRIFDSTGVAEVATVYEAVVWATDRGVKVINMSFGASHNSQALRDAVAYASARGVVMTGAVGNANTDAIMFPAGIRPTLGVASTDISDQKAWFSNFNYGVSVSAPGNGLITAFPGNRYARVWGSSFSSPLVASEAALMAQVWDSKYRTPASSDTMRSAIAAGVNDIYSMNLEYLGKLGTGRINYWKGLLLIIQN